MSLLEWMRRAGAGERVIKTALAAGLAWELGSRIPGSHAPYLASLGAILTMQITIADSVTAATQRILGVIVGVITALAISMAFGVNAVTIGVLALVSLMIGSALRLEPQGVTQVAVSSLLVLAVGSAGTIEFAYTRIAETITGVAVGLAVNALLAPPSHLDASRRSVERHAAALAVVVERLAAAIAEGITPEAATLILEEARSTDPLLREAQVAVTRSRTALRFNIWSRSERPQASCLANANRTLERVAMQARGIVRTVHESVERAAPRCPEWLDPNGLGRNLSAATAAAARMIRAFPAACGQPADPAASEAFAQAARVIAEERQAVATSHEARSLPERSDEWVQLGSVLADLDRIRRELAAAVQQPTERPLAPPTAPADAAAARRG